jgi:hypothetical protein
VADVQLDAFAVVSTLAWALYAFVARGCHRVTPGITGRARELIDCTVLWCDGCLCGGDYFNCVGCDDPNGKKYCFTGHNCTSFCLIPVC